jgi:hypothetical protein
VPAGFSDAKSPNPKPNSSHGARSILSGVFGALLIAIFPSFVTQMLGFMPLPSEKKSLHDMCCRIAHAGSERDKILRHGQTPTQTQVQTDECKQRHTHTQMQTNMQTNTYANTNA